MTKNSTKRALLMSCLSLLLCMSMLVGTTFAWFTDTATTGVNTIVAGNLDIVLEYMVFDEDGKGTWEEVTTDSLLFDENALYEPGYTEVAYLRIRNAGNLVLKYDLSVNFTNEVAGINKAGESFKLSDYLQFGVVTSEVDEQVTIYGSREEAQKAVEGNTSKLQSYSAKDYVVLNPNEAIEMALVVFMPTTVGNEANYKTGTTPPSIDLGVKVFATQKDSEEDSYGPDYDKEAPLLTDAEGNIIINDVGALFTFAKQVNGGDTFAGKTVKLNADIDLAGYDWTPIGNVVSYPSITFAGTFDGNGKTISNMNTTDDLAVYATAGLFGSITGTVKNLTIDKATVVSSHYAGGIVGYISQAGASVTGCTVTNSTIISAAELLASGEYDNGDKVGGVVGYMASGSTINGCKVQDTTVQGYRDIGGIVGYTAGTVTGNAVSNVKIVVDKLHDYKAYATAEEYHAGEIIGENYNNTATAADNSATGVVISNVVAVKDAAELNDVIANAGTAGETVVVLPAGEYTLPAMSDKNVTISGDKDTVVDLTNAVNASNSTVTLEGVTVTVEGDGTYKGIQHAEKVIYKNVTFNGTQFLYSDAEFTGCTFNVTGDQYNIWTYGNDVTFTDCTFNSDGKAVLVYHEGAVTAEVTFNNCKFNDNGDGTVGGKAAVEIGESAYGNQATYTIKLNGCEVNGFDVTTQNTSTFGGTDLGTNVWGNKNLMPADRLNIIIDGAEVY